MENIIDLINWCNGNGYTLISWDFKRNLCIYMQGNGNLVHANLGKLNLQIS